MARGFYMPRPESPSAAALIERHVDCLVKSRLEEIEKQAAGFLRRGYRPQELEILDYHDGTVEVVPREGRP